MDFLKACTTNIHAVENISGIPYTRYRSRHEEDTLSKQWSSLQTVLARLRGENVLCAAGHLDLYIFGDISPAGQSWARILQDQFEASGEGSIGAVPEETADIRLRDVFMAAIELSLAYGLARDPAITHVGPWTWLYSDSHTSEVDPESSLVIKLRARSTSADGLYLISDVTPTALCQVGSTSLELQDKVILAPFGQAARAVPLPSSKTRADGTNWRAFVVQLLQTEGLEISEGTEWIPVQLHDDHSGCHWTWPAQLCFAPSPGPSDIEATFSEDRDWRRWFISTEEGAIFRNPLAVTEEWYKGAADRQKATQTESYASAEADIAEPSRPAPVPETTTFDTDMAVSPSFTQRGTENLSAMNGIYPTPPDGFVPGQPAVLNAATPSVTQPEPSSSIMGTSPNDAMQSKPPAQLHFQPSDTIDLEASQDDLFGDVGEIGFGDTEIEDADFNFFDEPDDDFGQETATDGLNTVDPAVDLVRSKSSSHAREPDPAEPPRGVVQAAQETSSPEQARSVPFQAPTLEQPEAHEATVRVKSPDVQSPRSRRPLSPFGIREQLLPPPVPASHSQAQTDAHFGRKGRRDSSFTPITFREPVRSPPKYISTLESRNLVLTGAASGKVSITLPLVQPKVNSAHRNDPEDDSSDASDSEEDSYESSTSDSDEPELPPKLPWETKKRKRMKEDDFSRTQAVASTRMHESEGELQASTGSSASDTLIELLQRCTTVNASTDSTIELPPARSIRKKAESHIAPLSESLETLMTPLPSVESTYGLSKSDLVCVAQLVSEQSITANPHDLMTAHYLPPSWNSSAPITLKYIRDHVAMAIRTAIPDAVECDLTDVALSKDALLRQPSNPGKPPQGQPRPLQRMDGSQIGPDCFNLPSPFLRLRRGADAWEMLPACIPFWEPLGLSPAAGPKNLRAFCVFPFNEDLQRLVDHFLGDLSTAYESCKLGTHVHLRNVSEMDEHDNFEDGMAPVELGEDTSLEAALASYAATCSELGKALSSIAHQEAEDRAIVVYILNPFEGDEARQHLCACFWTLFQTYRDSMPRMAREKSGSDIFLQLVPITLVAAYDAFIPVDARQMSVLAREIYDRCPPTSALQLFDVAAPLPNLAAPTVELASMAPKRLGFQLTSDPPADLLFEGSILHLAYACSADAKWLTVSWIDSTGKYQSVSSFCLAGRTFAETAEEVWEHTRTILAARQVSWRVFIVAQNTATDGSVLQCWRALAARPRSQPICVTMLSIESKTLLQLQPPHTGFDHSSYANGEMGVLTPASTPQGATFTSSPDVAGHGGNAPLTPAPSETAASLTNEAAADADAQLTDMTDETWGVLLTAKLSGTAQSTTLAHGVLFQRGRAAISEIEQIDMVDRLPSLGVNIHWTIQVKPQGTVDEGSVKQAELTLREVLRMYRGLSLLTKAKSLECDVGSFAPLHIVSAVMGSAGLDGLIKDTGDEGAS